MKHYVNGCLGNNDKKSVHVQLRHNCFPNIFSAKLIGSEDVEPADVEGLYSSGNVHKQLLSLLLLQFCQATWQLWATSLHFCVTLQCSFLF